MQRMVTLGNGNRVTLGAYVRGWQACKASAPGTEFKHGLGGWWPQTREEILRDFMRSLHDRINCRVNGFNGLIGPRRIRGRKDQQSWPAMRPLATMEARIQL